MLIIILVPKKLISILGNKITNAVIPTFRNEKRPFMALLFCTAIYTLTDHSPPGVNISEIAVLKGCAGWKGHEEWRQDSELVVDEPGGRDGGRWDCHLQAAGTHPVRHRVKAQLRDSRLFVLVNWNLNNSRFTYMLILSPRLSRMFWVRVVNRACFYIIMSSV